jgi:hypothetical protein
LTSTGDLQIKPNSTAAVENETSASDFIYNGNLEQPISTNFNQFQLISTKTGETINRIGAFSELVAAKIKTGLIEAEDIIVNNVLVAKNIAAENISSQISNYQLLITKSLSALDASINQLIVTEKISSPVVETKDLIATGTAQLAQIETNEIKPQNGDLVFDLSSQSQLNQSESVKSVTDSTDSNRFQPISTDKGPLAQVVIKGLEGKTVATIDASGAATFASTVTAPSVVSDQLSAQNATISGSLAANEASVSGTLTAGNVEAENINQLENQVASLSGNLASQYGQGSALSLQINDIQKLLAEIKNTPLPDLTNQTNLSNTLTPDGWPNGLPSGDVYGQPTGLSLQDLTVTGNSNLYTVSVANSLTTGGLLFQDNTILSLSWELKLSALNNISLFDGAVMIAKDGTITTKGALIAQGGLRTNEIRPISSNDDLSIVLNSEKEPPRLDTINNDRTSEVNQNGKLKITNSQGSEVASIDASGSAQFNNLAINNLTINNISTNSAVIAAEDNFAKNGIFAPAIETATASAGLGLLPENSQEVIVYNDNIKENSLIYLTPTNSVISNQLSVVSKESCQTDSTDSTDSNRFNCHPYFKVALDKPTPTPVQFNWLIIN